MDNNTLKAEHVLYNSLEEQPWDLLAEINSTKYLEVLLTLPNTWTKVLIALD